MQDTRSEEIQLWLVIQKDIMVNVQLYALMLTFMKNSTASTEGSTSLVKSAACWGYSFFGS